MSKTLKYIFFVVLFAVAAAQFARAAVVDLGGETVNKSGSEFKTDYNGNTIQNGTVNLSSEADNDSLKDGTFTIGSGATLNATGEFRPNYNCTFNIVDGGTFSTAAVLCMPFRYGNQAFYLDNGTFTSSATATYSGGYCVNIGYMWNNKEVWENNSAKVVLNNGSTFAVTEGTLGFGRVKGHEKKVNIKIDFAVTNSSVVVSKGQMVIANSDSSWVKNMANSYIKAVFGPGSEITTGQIYVDGKYPTASVTFDGATIHWTGNNRSFIGHATAVGDVYEIQPNGLTIDIPSGKSLTCDQNASSLKGEGGITKIGDGSITWNNASSGGSAGMTFAGPLVVSNGTWSSSLSYAATSFTVDGANSMLALSGTLPETSEMSATQGGTLNLRTGSVVSRTLGTLTLGEGATLSLTGEAMGCDSVYVGSLVLSATTENPVALNFTDAANIPGGTYPIITITGGGTFVAGDEAKFALDANAPAGSELSVSGASLVLTVPLSNPATWTGGAGDGKFSSVGNWLGNAVPGALDDVIISVATETTLDCDVALNVNSITFPATSAQVTIEGTGCITNAATIVNGSSARHVIDVPVEFYASDAYVPIDVTGEVDFQGGVKGTLPANHSKFYGNYTLTQGSWPLSSAITLAANATVMATGTTITTSGTSLLNAEAGSALTINRLNLEAGGNIFGTFAGNLTVPYIYDYSHGAMSFNSGFSGVLRINGIHHHPGSGTGAYTFAPDKSATIIFGSGSCGIEMQRGSFDVNGYVFHSSGDWEFDITDSGYSGESGAGKITIGSNGIVVDTSDYDDPTAPGHTVSVNNTASKSTNALIGSGGLGVAGNGAFAFNKTGKFTGGLVASNSVTVAVKKDVNPGRGNVTFMDTATFDLVQSGSGAVPVTGTLTMAGGTTLRIPTFTAGVLPLSVNALAFEGVTSESKVALNIEGGALVEGYNAIIQSATALPADAWDGFNVSFGEGVVPDGMTPVYVAQGGTLYIVVKGANDAIWTGGGENANFSTGANWLGGEVPANGSCVHIAAAGEATLVCDIQGFAPASITFPAGSVAVTINGENAINVTAITNLSSASHTINVPVYFAGDIQVKQAAMAEEGDLTKAHVTFAGGAHAAEGYAIENGNSSAVYSRCMFGDYYFYPTSDNPWSALYQGSSKRPILGDNSALHVPYAGSLHELYIGNGSVVTANVVNLTSNQRLSFRNYGEYVITTEMTMSGSDKKDGFAGYSSGTGAGNVFKIEKATCTKTDGYTFYFADSYAASHGIYYFGAGGINFGSGKGYFGIGNKDGDLQTIRPWYGDFTIEKGSGNSSGFDIYMNRDVTFNTDDENGEGRTITVNARLRFQNNPSFTVAGKGKVLVNSVANNYNAEPPVTVKDTATLAFKPGASLTTSNITVKAGATLAVVESGVVAVSNLSLVSEAKLAFNFTDRRSAPVLEVAALDNVNTDPNGTVYIVVSGERPAGVRQVLTSGGQFGDKTIKLVEDGKPEWAKGVLVENGDIVLEVKPVGLAVYVR